MPLPRNLRLGRRRRRRQRPGWQEALCQRLCAFINRFVPFVTITRPGRNDVVPFHPSRSSSDAHINITTATVSNQFNPPLQSSAEEHVPSGTSINTETDSMIIEDFGSDYSDCSLGVVNNYPRKLLHRANGNISIDQFIPRGYGDLIRHHTEEDDSNHGTINIDTIINEPDGNVVYTYEPQLPIVKENNFFMATEKLTVSTPRMQVKSLPKMPKIVENNNENLENVESSPATEKKQKSSEGIESGDTNRDVKQKRSSGLTLDLPPIPKFTNGLVAANNCLTAWNDEDVEADDRPTSRGIGGFLSNLSKRGHNLLKSTTKVKKFKMPRCDPLDELVEKPKAFPEVLPSILALNDSEREELLAESHPCRVLSPETERQSKRKLVDDIERLFEDVPRDSGFEDVRNNVPKVEYTPKQRVARAVANRRIKVEKGIKLYKTQEEEDQVKSMRSKVLSRVKKLKARCASQAKNLEVEKKDEEVESKEDEMKTNDDFFCTSSVDYENRYCPAVDRPYVKEDEEDYSDDVVATKKNVMTEREKRKERNKKFYEKRKESEKRKQKRLEQMEKDDNRGYHKTPAKESKPDETIDDNWFNNNDQSQDEGPSTRVVKIKTEAQLLSDEETANTVKELLSTIRA